MLLQIPLRRVGDFRQDQRRLDWIERLGDVKLLVIGIRPGAGNIGDKFFRAPFRQQTRSELVSASGDRDNFDLGKFLLEVRENRLIAADVNNDLPFLLGAFESLLPLRAASAGL